MIGHIITSAFHKGTIFSQNASSYALLNGQTLSRTAYPDLSVFWPVGAYGSTITTMVLPDLGGSGYYFRGHGYNNGFDPGISSRAVPSGTLPVAPSGIGTFQTGLLISHTHASGTQSSAGRAAGGGDFQSTYPVAGTTTSATPSSVSGVTIVGAANANDTDLAHMKFYPYIRIL